MLDHLTKDFDFIAHLRATDAAVAIRSGDHGDLSYRGLGQSIEAAQTAAIHQGLGGRRIVTVLPDCLETLVLAVGLADISELSLLNPSLTDPELVDLIIQSDADVILSDAKATERLAQISQATHRPAITFTADLYDSAFSWQFQQHSDDNIGFREDVSPGIVLATAGSTGRPKRVKLSMQQMLASALNIAETLKLSSQDTVIHQLPMFHVGALVDLFLAPLLRGGTVVLAHPMSARGMIDAACAHRATWLQAVPTMVSALLSELDDDDVAMLGNRLRFVRTVSADLPPAWQQALEERLGGTPVIQMYGMTETAGQICSNALPPSERRPGSVGRPSGVELSVRDMSGDVCLDGQEGEICVRGETVFGGYEGDTDKDRFHDDWFRTGDLGRLDSNGFVYLSGRRFDVINRGGEKFSALEIERALIALEGVQTACVVGVPHKTLGEEAAAIVVPESGRDLGPAIVRDRLATKVADFKLPRHVRVEEALPLLPTGKIDRTTAISWLVEDSSAKHVDSAPSPTSDETHAKIEAAWRKHLKTDRSDPSDDFFDLGGDSLSAQGLIVEIEQALGRQLPVNILFENPTLGALMGAIGETDRSSEGVTWDDPLYDAVKAMTATWPGERKSPWSLITQVTVGGDKQPVFICTSARDYFTDIAAIWSGHRSLYAMRSLAETDLKSEDNVRKLGAWCAQEIDELQPDGPICLSGQCQGAIVAMAVADSLRERGRHVNLMVVLDRIVERAYGGNTALIWSRTTEFSAVTQFEDHDRGDRIRYPNHVDTLLSDQTHDDLTCGTGARDFSNFVDQLLGSDALPSLTSAQITEDEVAANAEIARRQTLYVGSIDYRPPILAVPSATFRQKVRIKNDSEHEWAPSDQSGLKLVARWQRANGEIRDGIAGISTFDRAIKPGVPVDLRIQVRFPERRRPARLRFFLVDDGLASVLLDAPSHTTRRVWPRPRLFGR